MNDYDTCKGLTSLESEINGSNYRILIINSRYNFEYVKILTDTVYKTLNEKYHVKPENIFQYTVPGAYELPFTAYHFINIAKYQNVPFDAVVCIGVLNLNNYENVQNNKTTTNNISDSVAQGIMKISIKTNTPIVYGIISDCKEIIEKNCGISKIYRNSYNQGFNWAETAIEMAKVHSIKILNYGNYCLNNDQMGNSNINNNQSSSSKSNDNNNNNGNNNKNNSNSNNNNNYSNNNNNNNNTGFEIKSDNGSNTISTFGFKTLDTTGFGSWTSYSKNNNNAFKANTSNLFSFGNKSSNSSNINITFGTATSAFVDPKNKSSDKNNSNNNNNNNNSNNNNSNNSLFKSRFI